MSDLSRRLKRVEDSFGIHANCDLGIEEHKEAIRNCLARIDNGEFPDAEITDPPPATEKALMSARESSFKARYGCSFVELVINVMAEVDRAKAVNAVV